MSGMIKRRITPIILMVFMVSFSGLGRAAGDLPDTFVLMPMRTIAVKGDAAKFRALNWMNDGSTGGIKDMTIERDAAKGEHVSFEGHAIPGDKDLGADLTLTKDSVGYMKLNYNNFRKWYDNVGGHYPLFQHLSVNSLDNSDLHLDMGHFLFEFGSGPSDDPTLSLTYERDTKTGQKSRLSWTGVYDSAVSSSTADAKKIGPSWEGMDEATDTLTLRGKAETLGFTLKGQGSYEFFDASNSREYKALSVITGTTQNVIRQESQPQTKLLTTNVMAERWSLNDKTYVSLGYRFGHNHNSEIISLRTYTVDNVLTGTLSKDGLGLTNQDTHTWTGQLMSNLTEDLNFTTKAKAELISRHSSGDYFSDTTSPPDGIYEYINAAMVENKIMRTGESAALRYNGIPKTSLYAEMDLEQESNWVTEAENHPQASSNTKVNREEIARNSNLIETLGARFVPTRTVNMTTQYKHSFMGQTFNTLYKTPAIALNYNSIFNRMNLDIDETASKVSWKPVKWLENSLKYKVAERVYHTNAVSEDWEKAQLSEQDYIYDLMLMPTDALMFNLSYSLQDLKASTRESQITDNGVYGSYPTGIVGIPVFTANVYTWMFTTSYAPKDNFSIFNTVEYSRAKNPNNPPAETSSMRYGVDDQWWNMTYGVRWSPKKDLTIEPHYAYYSFIANQSTEAGNYSAHVMWLDLKYNW